MRMDAHSGMSRCSSGFTGKWFLRRLWPETNGSTAVSLGRRMEECKTPSRDLTGRRADTDHG